MLEELFDRARRAVETARVETRRTELLAEYVRRSRRRAGELPLRCAWCGRISLAGSFVDPDDFLTHGLPSEVDERYSHGICPDCFEHEMSRRR